MTAHGRLGVLGGTFDPIHYGHLRAGEAAEAALTLDEILVVPSHDPPHRPLDPRASTFHRFALAALALDGRPNWRLSDMELTRPGPSYTAHTLRALHADGWQPSHIFFILGADAFAEIDTWYDFPAVLEYAQFAVIARPGTRLKTAEPTPARVHMINADTPDISSSDIRTRLAARRPIDGLVPPAVARYILTHRLYESSAVNDLHGKTERTHG